MINKLVKSVHPIFVLEGPDGAGKTSLAKALVDLTGARYIHLTYRFPDKMHLYHTAALRMCMRLSMKSPVVLDRWWPSEIVYADAYRGGSKFTKYYFMLEHVANEIGLVYAMCLPDDKKRYIEHYNVLKSKRAEMYDEGLDRVYDGYRDIYDNYLRYKMNVCHFDMFNSYRENKIDQDFINAKAAGMILEFAEDYRSTMR